MPFASSSLGGARSANVHKFRQAYDEKFALSSGARELKLGTYNAVVHFVALNTIAACVIAFAVWKICTAPEAHWRAGALTCVLSFIFSNFAEYYLHRFDMHHPESKSDHSPVHHRYFTANSMFLKSFQDCYTILFSTAFIWKGFTIYLPCIGMAMNALFFPTCGYFFLATGASYYLQYEWLHLTYHASPDSILGRLPFVALLRHHHRVHHHQPFMRSWNFNISQRHLRTASTAQRSEVLRDLMKQCRAHCVYSCAVCFWPLPIYCRQLTLSWT
jgi:hypothetical protein